MKRKLLVLMLSVLYFDTIYAQIPANVPTNGLVGWYGFSGNANDQTGSGRDANYIGAGVSLTLDRFGNTNAAYNFNGSPYGYIKIPATGLPTTDATVSIWFNVQTVANRPCLLGYGGQYGQRSSYFQSLNTAGYPSFWTSSHWGYNQLQYAYSEEPINQWIHYVVTISGPTIKMFINGQLVASNNSFVYPNFVTGRDLIIGTCVSPSGYGSYVDVNVGRTIGKLDDIGFWNRALSDCEIEQLYGGIFPIVVTKNVTITLDQFGIASIAPSDIDDGSYDNGSIASTNVIPNQFTCADIGENIVTLEVIDNCGNISQATETVTVLGVIPTCNIAAVPSNGIYTGGSPTTIFLGYGPQSAVLDVTAYGGTNLDYSWSGDIGLLSSASVEDPVFTPLVAGTYPYEVTVTNNFGCKSTCVITVEVIDVRCKNNKVALCHNGQPICISPSAVNDHLLNHPGDYLGDCGNAKNWTASSAEEFSVAVYPNPSNSAFNLELITDNQEDVKIEVFDLNGKLLTSFENLGWNNLPAIGGEFAPGMYLLAVTQKGITTIMRISKVN